jgi:hypothetical protein
MYLKLLELDSLHKRIIKDVAMEGRMISRWFNLVPSAEKKRMGTFQREWESFNLDIIRYAREVGLYSFTNNAPIYLQNSAQS